jgi:hypothetical protein
MVHKTPILVVAVLILFAAGVAAANGLLIGPNPGLAVGGGSVVAQSSNSTGTTTTTPTTTGPTTGTAGTVSTAAPSTGGTTTTTTTGTNGTTTTGTTTNGTTTGGVTSPTTVGTAAIDQIVGITRAVPPGTPVTAFTVPAGQQLVITDLVVTNPGTTPTCGAAVSPSGTTTTTNGTTTNGTTTNGTTTNTPESGTGLLCVPAQTSLTVGLTTGLEFDPGQGVVLTNATTTGNGAGTTATLHYLLRGFLVSTTPTAG